MAIGILRSALPLMVSPISGWFGSWAEPIVGRIDPTAIAPMMLGMSRRLLLLIAPRSASIRGQLEDDFRAHRRLSILERQRRQGVAVVDRAQRGLVEGVVAARLDDLRILHDPRLQDGELDAAGRRLLEPLRGDGTSPVRLEDRDEARA